MSSVNVALASKSWNTKMTNKVRSTNKNMKNKMNRIYTTIKMKSVNIKISNYKY